MYLTDSGALFQKLDRLLDSSLRRAHRHPENCFNGVCKTDPAFFAQKVAVASNRTLTC
ncbi:uncharacterized protein PHALS_01736 [Plasmopara halstedii]|uniref:Uncharacterized protein n=1 Tax=Plasmopara halstedii TaxID=4781 RepID=A0A0P1AU51_PLAHL|nr:uncharacterized protein PHALS_01736 [Plasmopara halstedii]CEG45442.1 hypothetical protein PHALS_01736 [Plasmopara halstedii]|eukprot:XP_024581811.1 hypothetical protein PHALS_01736 [Plasmopara halstedii]